MKKNFLKKVCVAAMAVVMTVGSAMSALAADMSYNAGFSYSNSAWSTSVWGDTDTTKTTFTGEGTYTFTWTPGVTVDDCIMILVDIGEEGGDAADVLAEYELTEVIVKLDGEALDVDLSKVQCGNLEGKGRYRIEVYNTYGGTKDASPIDINAVKDFETLEITFTLDDPATQPETETTTAASTETTTADGAGAGETTTAATATGTPSTGDTAMVGLFVALAAVSAVVVLKKRTVTE